MSENQDLAISPDVLYGIAQLALEDIDGLTPATPPARVGEILSGRRAKGIRVERTADVVRVVLNVSVTYGKPIPEVAAQAQKAVREAVASMTGLEVETVEVHVDAIDLPAELTGG